MRLSVTLLGALLALLLPVAAGAAAPAAGTPAAGTPAAVDFAATGKAAGGERLLALDPAVAPSWADANVGLLVVRGGGEQSSLLPATPPKAALLPVALPGDGCAVVVAEVGPPSAKGRPDSWRRVTRSVALYACAPEADAALALAARRAFAETATAKAGTAVEIRPLANPLALRPGGDLPVRLYAEQGALPGAVVAAHGPGGRVVRAHADAAGIARLRLPVAGRWLLRLVVDAPPGDDVPRRVAELVFDLAGEDLLRAAGETP